MVIEVDEYLEEMDCEEFIGNPDTFTSFTSKTEHLLKNIGDIPFIGILIDKDVVRYCYDKKLYLECFYLLGMLDYLYRCNNISCIDNYNDVRKYKFTKLIYPAGVELESYILKDEKIKEKYYKKAIPEFLSYNLVLANVRNVV